MVNDWISVTDRIPDDRACVLCVGAQGKMFIGVGSYRKSGNKASAVISGGNRRAFAYWMPLPTEPKQRKASPECAYPNAVNCKGCPYNTSPKYPNGECKLNKE